MQPRDDDPLARTMGLFGLAASLLVLVVLLLSSAATIFAGHPVSGAAGVIVFGPCATGCTQALWRRLLAA
jgi:hypothetical protein